MGLEQFITEENKIASLTSLRNRLFEELYSLCIRAAIDPDEMDYLTWTTPEYNENNSGIYNVLETIGRMCQSLKIIDQKIGS